jgi:hypothetical protein
LRYSATAFEWNKEDELKGIALTLLVLTLLGLTIQAAPAFSAEKTQITVEIVSADTARQTITVRVDGKTDELTMPVTGNALEKLNGMKSGEKAVLVLLQDEDTQKQSVIEIQPVEGPAEK